MKGKLLVPWRWTELIPILVAPGDVLLHPFWHLESPRLKQTRAPVRVNLEKKIRCLKYKHYEEHLEIGLSSLLNSALKVPRSNEVEIDETLKGFTWSVGAKKWKFVNFINFVIFPLPFQFVIPMKRVSSQFATTLWVCIVRRGTNTTDVFSYLIVSHLSINRILGISIFLNEIWIKGKLVWD